MYEKEIIQSKHEISIIVNFDEIFWKGKKKIYIYPVTQKHKTNINLLS